MKKHSARSVEQLRKVFELWGSISGEEPLNINPTGSGIELFQRDLAKGGTAASNEKQNVHFLKNDITSIEKKINNRLARMKSIVPGARRSVLK